MPAGGRLVATELDPIKAERAAHNFRAAGLSELIDLRVGDAFGTLKAGLGGGIDLLLLDGWKEAYLPMLRFLEPQLSPGALVVADDLDIAPQALAPYLDYVRKPGSGSRPPARSPPGPRSARSGRARSGAPAGRRPAAP